MVAQPRIDANHFCASKNVNKKTKMGAEGSDPARKPAGGRQVAATINAPAQKILYSETHPQRQKKR